MTANKAKYKLFHSLLAAGGTLASPHLIRLVGTCSLLRPHLRREGKQSESHGTNTNKHKQTLVDTPPRRRTVNSANKLSRICYQTLPHLGNQQSYLKESQVFAY